MKKLLILIGSLGVYMLSPQNSENIYFIKQAVKVSEKSTCLKREIGAVIVKNNKIIGEGHNGGPHGKLNSKGFGECYYERLAKDEAKKRNIKEDSLEFLALKKEFKIFCLSICAEKSAVVNTIKNKNSELLKNSTMYCTTFPCPVCAKVISEVGIKKVYFLNEFNADSPLGKETLRIFSEYKVGYEQLFYKTDQGLRKEYGDNKPINFFN